MLSTYFFFKQKTAYKMRISDWSSDVCASDLWAGIGYHFVVQLDGSIEAGRPEGAVGSHVAGYNGSAIGVVYKIGRASCRERVCQYVYISVVAVSLKKTEQPKSTSYTGNSIYV